MTLDDDGNGEWESLLNERYLEGGPEISPDGRFMAYEATPSGQAEIYVRPYPDIYAGRQQVSAGRGGNPVWSKDGREIFYQRDRTCDGTNLAGCEKDMMAVTIDTESTLAVTAGVPEMLFEDPYYSSNGLHFDVAKDGQFLMIKSLTEPLR